MTPGRHWLLHRLSRRTASTTFIPQIDGLRFYAVVAVLAFHVVGYLMNPAKNPAAGDVARTWLAHVSRAGHSGVELFFVISGFILALPFARAAAGRGPRVTLRRYFLRRITRLEPPYVINLLLLTFLLLATGRAVWPELAPHLLASLCYCHNAVFGAASRINAVAWTLEIEVQFYVLAPVLAGLFAVRDSRVRLLLLGGCILGAAALSSVLTAAPWVPNGLRLSLASYLQYFLVGFALADWYARGGDDGPPSAPADALALPCAAAPFLLEPFPALRCFLLPCAFGGLCLSALKGRVHRQLTAAPLLVLVGGMCYTIYLYHPALKAALGPAVVGATPTGLPVLGGLLTQVAILGVAIVGLCVPLFLCFERPFMAFRARRRPTPPLSGGPADRAGGHRLGCRDAHRADPAP